MSIERKQLHDTQGNMQTFPPLSSKYIISNKNIITSHY